MITISTGRISGPLLKHSGEVALGVERQDSSPHLLPENIAIRLADDLGIRVVMIPG